MKQSTKTMETGAYLFTKITSAFAYQHCKFKNHDLKNTIQLIPSLISMYKYNYRT